MRHLRRHDGMQLSIPMPSPRPKKYTSPILAQKAIVDKLSSIQRALEDGKPKEPTKWYEKAYATTANILKYIGIPGVILAAIGPVQKVFLDYRESHNQHFVRDTYIQYSSSLLSDGFIDRANDLLSVIEKQKDFDHRIMYYKARTLIAMALQQGRNYVEAYDTAKILSNIQDRKDFLFPSVGGTGELVELKLALIDI
jgi:hypothetical protein